MREYLIKAYTLDVCGQSAEELTQQLYDAYIAPLTSYVGAPRRFFQMETSFVSPLGRELLLTERFLLDDENRLEERSAWLGAP